MIRTRVMLLILLGTATCLLAKVFADYDRTAPFDRYQTYSWIGVRTEDSLWNDRISGAIDKELADRGWMQVAEGGDIAVAAFGATRNETALETWYTGFGGGWTWKRSWEGASADPERIQPGSIVVDLFDRETRKLVWQGNAANTLSGDPAKIGARLKHDLSALFRRLPQPVD